MRASFSRHSVRATSPRRADARLVSPGLAVVLALSFCAWPRLAVSQEGPPKPTALPQVVCPDLHRDIRPQYLPEGPAAANDTERRLREARDRLHNWERMTPLKKGLPEGGMSTFMSSPPYEPLPALPLKDADIVVIADVAGEQPFWSQNGATIYTDYSLTIHMQIKSPPGAILASSLLVTQAGGGIRRP